jgi:LysM repeat protein
MTEAQIAVQYAKSKISNAAYLWGGNGPTRFDCSGLTSQAWLAAGVHIPRTSQAQLSGLKRVALKDIAPGDLVIYSFGNDYAGHVAMYVGPIGPNGEDLIDTSSRHPNGGVGWSSMKTRGGTVAGVVRPGGDPTSTTPVEKPKTETDTLSAAKTYTVVHGDSLWAIAKRFDIPGGWQALYAANKHVVGGNPDLIFPGQVLRLN